MSRVRFWSGDEVFRDVPGSGWAGRDCFGGQSGEGQWSGWLLMSSEILRCFTAGQTDRETKTFESLLHVHVRVPALWSGCLLVLVLPYNSLCCFSRNCFETNFHILFYACDEVLVLLFKVA